MTKRLERFTEECSIWYRRRRTGITRCAPAAQKVKRALEWRYGEEAVFRHREAIGAVLDRAERAAKPDRRKRLPTMLVERLEQHYLWLTGQGGQRAVLAGEDLSHMDLAGLCLYKADLAGAKLEQADLQRTDLRYADLSYADLRFAYLANALLDYANLEKSFLALTYLDGVSGVGANLSDACLAGASAEDADFSSADLSYANLTGASMPGARLCRARMYDTMLVGADLTKADLREADLRGAHATRACLRQARLNNALLLCADFRDANLAFAEFGGAQLNFADNNLLAAVLFYEARDEESRRMAAWLSYTSTNRDWESLRQNQNRPEYDWAVQVLAKYVRDDDNAPSFLRNLSNEEAK